MRGMPVACLIQLDAWPVIKIFDILEGQDMSNCQLFNPGLLPLSDKCDGTRNPGKMTWGAAARLSSFQELFFFFATRFEKASSGIPPASRQPSSVPSPHSTSRHLSSSLSKRQDGLRASGKAATPQAVQIQRCRPQSPLALRAETVLHKCRYQILPHVDGSESHHIDWVLFRYYQCVDAVVV